MSLAQRVSLMAGALVAALLVFIVLQGATQEVETQTEDRSGETVERSSFPTPDRREFAEARSS
jgi:hypothetical protein